MSPHTKPILGVDLDNVLADTDPLIRRMIWEMCGIRLERENVTHFDYRDCSRLTDTQNYLLWHRFHTIECLRVKPVAEAVEALYSLSDEYKIHIVTNRPPETRGLTLEWLSKHDVLYDRLDFAKDKTVSGIPFTAFIEDKRETAYAMAERGVKSFLLDCPWNQPMSADPSGVIRVGSWSEILGHLLSVKCY